ncbi:hypothetical protein [Glutamicibacter arilaitensis]|uniref:hypothetical protein n=1 Tax=Glutamicibacter arilaitensis TaxID=256701 RepID=UPI003FD1E0F3
MKPSRKSPLALAAVVAGSIALAGTGCAADASKEAQPASADNPVTLTVTTFGTQGLDPLYEKYEKETPESPSKPPTSTPAVMH